MNDITITPEHIDADLLAEEICHEAYRVILKDVNAESTLFWLHVTDHAEEIAAVLVEQWKTRARNELREAVQNENTDCTGDVIRTPCSVDSETISEHAADAIHDTYENTPLTPQKSDFFRLVDKLHRILTATISEKTRQPHPVQYSGYIEPV